jgi:crossover junction endodeoxyribonuclease RuvC
VAGESALAGLHAGSRSVSVLGIDPGTRRTGYAVLVASRGQLECRKLGTIKLNEKWDLPRRLGRLGLEITRLVDRYQPQEVSIEQAIYAQNVRTALALGQARGAILFCAVTNGCEIFEYSPREVKRAVTGSGNASKLQVQGMIRRLLGLRREFDADEADAAALALCHLLRPSHPELAQSGMGTTGVTRSKARRSSKWTEADVARLKAQGRIR